MRLTIFWDSLAWAPKNLSRAYLPDVEYRTRSILGNVRELEAPHLVTRGLKVVSIVLYLGKVGLRPEGELSLR